jgi:hypothetical protein|tara:strand:- start:967 stop:1440 length:474 start_codon:yes stop_codon:yes gene_type:complete
MKMNYADLKWSIIQEWNSDAKFTNEYLIELASASDVVIKNTHADRKSIVATAADGIIVAGVESGEYIVADMGEDSDSDIRFKNYMGDLPIPTSNIKLDSTVADDVEVYSYEDVEEEELPDFKKMSKKKLDDWALERGIELDRRQTKSNMIAELEEKL